MIDAMKNGWCNLSFQTKGNEKNGELLIFASYLTNVPEDILHFCEEYLSNGTASVWFDEEGSFATIVATPDDVYAIVSGDGDQLVVLDYNPKDFVRKWLTDLLAFQSKVVAFRTDYEDLSEKERLSIERKFSYRVKKALNKMDEQCVACKGDVYYV